jgi:hypothetical protein
MASTYRTYGGASDDFFYGVAQDTDYIYAVGATRSEGLGWYDGLIVKFNKADLSIAVRKRYGGGATDSFQGVTQDVDYVYAVGRDSTNNPLIIKFNKADLSIAARKKYQSTGTNTFYSVTQDTNFVYAVGNIFEGAAFATSGLIIKFNKAALSIAARKYYGGGASTITEFLGCDSDNDYVYAVGYSNGEGTGNEETLLVKFNKADLSIAARKRYGGASNEEFRGVCQDSSFVYAVGWTYSEGQGLTDCLLVKFNKSDLSIAARKVYGGVSADGFHGIVQDTDYIYAVGYTWSEGEGSGDFLIVKFNKSDLSIAVKKVYGGAQQDEFRAVALDTDYIYATGFTYSEGAGGSDCVLVKFDKSLGTSPGTATLKCLQSNLTLANSGLTLVDSGLTLANSAKVLANSTLTLANSTLTLSALKSVQTGQFLGLLNRQGGAGIELALVPAGQGQAGWGGIPKLRKGGVTYDLLLVTTSHAMASPLRVAVGGSVRAVRKYG